MNYQRKLYLLSGLTAALALTYVLTLVFDPDRMGARRAAHTWLDPERLDRVDGILISGGAGEEPLELRRRGGPWTVVRGENEYPARELRIDDFLRVLSSRGEWPVRSVSPSSHRNFGLEEEGARRVQVLGGPGLPLLDILVGKGDRMGREVFVRRTGAGEVRSGEDRITVYLEDRRNSWYNLRLFPESESGKLDAGNVQRLSLYADGEERTWSRSGAEWIIGGMGVAKPDRNKVEAYVRGILNTEAEDFAAPGDSPGPESARLVLELDDGSLRTLLIGTGDVSGKRLVSVSGSSPVYVLSGWASERIFRDAAYFETQ
ncbi:MAG: DUF4340 domain-containing protein [Treponema sp.]|jgi:hypothetical protein|nr:DUF4340 domain-containing protein [Treponema sp.]